MSIVSIRDLSPCEVARLGNNIIPPKRSSGLAAVNRSLAVHDEQVHRLYAAPPDGDDWGRTAPLTSTRRRLAR